MKHPAIRFRLFTGIGLLALTPILDVAGQEDARPAKGIQDNSFLVEEAYNQESGVVQHIFNFTHFTDLMPGSEDRAWNVVFTQEWPVASQAHQFSYTLPYSLLESGGPSVNGFGDILLNYRYQALTERDRLPAFAPRVSLILPSGDDSKGLGNDTVGFQFNLPFSKIVHDRWTVHANAGLTLFPDLKGRNPVNYFLAASAIYAVTPNFNLMLESVAEWTEDAAGGGLIDRDFGALLSPGARYAFNFSGSQLVLGVAAPLGLTKSAPDYGVFLYLSFEHRFLR